MSRRLVWAMIWDPYFIISPAYDFLIEPFLSSIKKLTARVLSEQIDPPGHNRILEVACGTGTQARLLAKKGFTVFALERSPGMVGRLRIKIRSQDTGKIIPIHGDVTDIPMASATVDAVIIQLALHELTQQDRQRCISELKRVSKDQAIFIFLDFVPTNKFTPSNCLIILAELAAGINHYKNGREFLTKGGLLQFVQLAGFKIKKTFFFFKGNLCLAVALKKFHTP